MGMASMPWRIVVGVRETTASTKDDQQMPSLLTVLPHPLLIPIGDNRYRVIKSIKRGFSEISQHYLYLWLYLRIL